MEPATRNLCAHIPVELHEKVRQQQTASGKTLNQYMTWLIETFYKQEEKTPMTNDSKRTVAFQVPEELFTQFKAYLKRHNLKQNAFFLNCIQEALSEESENQPE